MEPIENRIKGILEKGGPGIYEIILDEHHFYNRPTFEIIETKNITTLPQRIVSGSYEGVHDELTFTLKASFLVPKQIPYNIVRTATRTGDLPPPPKFRGLPIEILSI